MLRGARSELGGAAASASSLDLSARHLEEDAFELVALRLDAGDRYAGHDDDTHDLRERLVVPGVRHDHDCCRARASPEATRGIPVSAAATASGGASTLSFALRFCTSSTGAERAVRRRGARPARGGPGMGAPS